MLGRQERPEFWQRAQCASEPQEVVEGDPSGALKALHRVAGYASGLGECDLSQAAPQAPSSEAACEIECDGGWGKGYNGGFWHHARIQRIVMVVIYPIM